MNTATVTIKVSGFTSKSQKERVFNLIWSKVDELEHSNYNKNSPIEEPLIMKFLHRYREPGNFLEGVATEYQLSIIGVVYEWDADYVNSFQY